MRTTQEGSLLTHQLASILVYIQSKDSRWKVGSECHGSGGFRRSFVCVIAYEKILPSENAFEALRKASARGCVDRYTFGHVHHGPGFRPQDLIGCQAYRNYLRLVAFDFALDVKIDGESNNSVLAGFYGKATVVFVVGINNRQFVGGRGKVSTATTSLERIFRRCKSGRAGISYGRIRICRPRKPREDPGSSAACSHHSRLFVRYHQLKFKPQEYVEQATVDIVCFKMTDAISGFSTTERSETLKK
mmetsp:Transcript_19522/g.42430  ORF Transcript_19522/g.42430 Transcript_19522/m.42430 type:complete len:246 (-) Transcript_19522:10-747(-)